MKDLDLKLINGLIKIKETSGNNAKEDLLKENDSPEFKQILKYLSNGRRKSSCKRSFGDITSTN